jgi:YVTN family beta-propeller protein
MADTGKAMSGRSTPISQKTCFRKETEMAVGSIQNPSGRNSSSYNRTAKAKVLLCAVALVLGASVGWSQPAPDTILLPDSLGPLRPPYHLAFGSSTDNIYVASESSDIIVVDGLTSTFQRIKRINTSTPVGGALLVSQHNKLYCSYPQQGRIGVIDCASNTIVGSIQVGTRPTLLCYSSGSDKLYCADTIDCTVSVIDCATNEVLKVIPVGARPTALCYEPTTNKVYAGTRDALLAISSSADSVVSSISEAAGARGLCVNKHLQKLYVVLPSVAGSDTILVVSTLRDSVLGRLYGSGGDFAPMLACNEATDRMYCASDVTYDLALLLQFDCIWDTLISEEPFTGPSKTAGLACDSVQNRLYWLYWWDEFVGCLAVWDCATSQLIHGRWVDDRPDFLAMDPSRSRIVLCGGAMAYLDYAEMMAFDYKGDTMCARGAVPLSGWVQYMYRNPVAGKLYFQWGGSYPGGLGVVDEHSNRQVDQVFLPCGDWGRVVYSRTSDKFYYRAPDQGLGIMDGTSDSIIKVIPMVDIIARHSPCWYPEGNKVYCRTYADDRGYVAVVDCSTDSIMREIDLSRHEQLGFEYLGEGRLLSIQNDRLTLIDCRADTILTDSSITVGGYSAVHTGDGKKLYFAHDGSLGVLNSNSLDLISMIDWPYGGYPGVGGDLLYSDTTHKLYWFSGRGESTLAIDTRSDTVVSRIADSASGRLACLDHTGRYLFCTGYFNSCMRVYDTQSDSLVGTYPHPQYPNSIMPAPEQHCIYLGFGDLILGYHDVPPGIDETPNEDGRAMASEPTIVRRVLVLGAPGRRKQAVCRTVLLNGAGRKVAELHAGVNDIRSLSPGVYFMRTGEPATTRKIVLMR